MFYFVYLQFSRFLILAVLIKVVNIVDVEWYTFLLKPLISCRYERSKWYHIRGTQNIEHKLTIPNCSWSE